MKSFIERQPQMATMPIDLARLNAELLLGMKSEERVTQEFSRHRDSWDGVTGQFGEEPVAVWGEFVVKPAGEKRITINGRTMGVLGEVVVLDTDFSVMMFERPIKSPVIAAELKGWKRFGKSGRTGQYFERFVVASLVDRPEEGDPGYIWRPVFLRVPGTGKKSRPYHRRNLYY